MRLSTSLRLNAQKGLVTPYDPTLTLSLQFAARQAYVSNFGPLPTFTNATTTARTYVGSDGLLKTAGLNVPRIEFNPITRQCLGLLIEEQRQNLTIRSDDFGNAAWSKTAISVTSDNGVSPDGTTNADLLSETAVSSGHSVLANTLPSITSGTVYTMSVFLKKGTGSTAPDWVILSFVTGGFGTVRAAFNVSTGVFGGSTGSFTSSVKQYTNGWYRVAMTATATATTGAGSMILYFSNNTNTFTPPTYLGQTTSDIFIWGAQFEAGSFASSYIPTTTTSLVRSADVCSITGAAFTGFYNANEGTMVCKYDRPSAASESHMTIDNGTSNERLVLQFSGITERFGQTNAGGGTSANLDAGFAGAINTRIGHAARYKLNDFAFSCNGASVVTNTTLTVPNVNQLTIGNRLGGIYINGHIHTIQYFNAIKTNAQLQDLSTP